MNRRYAISKMPPVTVCPLCGAELRPVRTTDGDMLACPNYQDGCKINNRPLDSTEFRAIGDAIKAAYEQARDEAVRVYINANIEHDTGFVDAVCAMQYHPASPAPLSAADESDQVDRERHGRL